MRLAAFLIPFGILAALVAMMAYQIRKAPRGYQDRRGFHEGDEP